jgi:hypothetical protein
MCRLTNEEIIKLGTELVEWIRKDGNIWLKDFAILKEIPYSRLQAYSKSNEKFSELFRRAKDIQESKLINDGLSTDGNYDKSFIKFMLKNLEDWKSRTGKNKEEIQTPQINLVLKENKNRIISDETG